MEPADKSPPDGDVSIPTITPEDLERLANPLTVVHGYTALLQRRLRRGQTIDDGELLQILDLICESSRLITVGLTALVVQNRAKKLGPDPEQ